MVVLFFAGLGLTYFVFTRVPKSFVPDEDQGFLIVVMQSPAGASLEYTTSIGNQVTQIMRRQQEVENIFSVAGFSFSGAAANQGLMFVSLKPYSQRKGEQHSAPAILNRIRPQLFGVSGAIVFATLPPTIQGLGAFGGFQFVVQDLAAHTLDELSAATQGLIRIASQRKDLVSLYTPFTANDPAVCGHDRPREGQESCTCRFRRLPTRWACTWDRRTSTTSISITAPIGSTFRPTSNSDRLRRT